MLKKSAKPVASIMFTERHTGVSKIAQSIIDASFYDNYSPPHQLGPDYIIPTNDQWSWYADKPVKLNFQETYTEFPPQSVVTYFETGVKKYPNNCALKVVRNNKKIKWTYTEYLNDVKIAAKGFIKLGLDRFSAVAILGFNSPEWFISHFAAVFSGALPTGIYSTNSAEACHHILNDSSANIIIVENEIQLDKILRIRNLLPNLKAIIQYSGTITQPDILSWEDLMAIGRSIPDEVLNKRIRSLSINQCCALVYTSATTGKAKGVMLTHDNITYTIRFFVNHVVCVPKGSELSYLPLSHVAAMQSDIYGPIYSGVTVYFPNPDVLKGKLGDYLIQAKPAAFFGVPRIFEKISEKIQETEQLMPPIKKKIFLWARKNAIDYNSKKLASTNALMTAPFNFKLGRQLVLKKVKKMLGWDQCLFFFAGGAPLSQEVINFFLSLDILITECFGMSETSGPFVSNTVKCYRIGTVGKISLGEIKFENQDEKGKDEMLLRGRNVFMGYLNLEKTTRESLQSDGWFNTGDLGYRDKDGFVTITGRSKELIITSGGENVAPLPIENRIKQLLSIVNNCVLIGENRKYLTLIITLKVEVNMETYNPTDQLTQTAINWCQNIGSESKTVSEILNGPDETLLAVVQTKIDEYNAKHAISNAQKIQKWVILPTDFSLPGGEIGPSMKLKRQVILNKYKATIEKMYASKTN